MHYIYSDHLGSAGAIQKASGGAPVITRYYPFGGYRDGAGFEPITDRGYTGHRENRDIGLTYMNARFYVPSIARFASADTIVPNPENPQSFNRYSYVENRPLLFIDPSGHIKCNNSNLPGDDQQACTIPTKALVNALIGETVELIDGSFKIRRTVLRDNITQLLIVSAEYGLERDETAYLLATAFGETRFGAGIPPDGYFDDLVENIKFGDAEREYGVKNPTEKNESLGNYSEGDGWFYRGRGFAQLTGKTNYQRMQAVFGYEYGVDMVSNPDVVAEDSRLAAEIAVYGMENGSFTGYSFNDARATNDFFYNARRIINGTSGAGIYKRRAIQYNNALTVSSSSQ